MNNRRDTYAHTTIYEKSYSYLCSFTLVTITVRQLAATQHTHTHTHTHTQKQCPSRHFTFSQVWLSFSPIYFACIVSLPFLLVCTPPPPPYTTLYCNNTL